VEDNDTGDLMTIFTNGRTYGTIPLLETEPSGSIVGIKNVFLYEHEKQIWRTDGTPSGTYAILDRSSDGTNMMIQKLNEKFIIAINDSVYLTDGSLSNMQGYSIDVKINVAEYWEGKSIWGELFIDNSDQNGVSLISIMDESLSLIIDYANLFVKERYEQPLDYFFTSGDRIYFKANDGISGYKLWVLDFHCAVELFIDNICSDPVVYTSDVNISLTGATQAYTSTQLNFRDALTVDSTFEVKISSQLIILAGQSDCR
jgi:hypothetical protein